ncbi:hypothetical protein B7453_22300 [Pseudomonas sp. IB20]|nr:hypothetical protein B7453_22300 [Pseudomonas sp. IB20]
MRPTSINCGSWLACDADTSVLLSNRGDAIAGKPTPTQTSSHSGAARPLRELFGHFFWNVGIRINVLHIIQVFKHIEHL